MSSVRSLKGPALLLVAACGLLLVAFGDKQAFAGAADGETLFWVGLAVVLGPIAWRLCGPGAGRSERLALVVGLGLALFLVKVLHSPTQFTRFDEFGWWRSTHEVIAGGGAFNANPLNPAAAGYPAVATITAAVSQLTGLGIFASGLIVIGAARAVLALFLFLLLERLVGSSRAAGVGVLIYVCNSSFLYFDSQFAYESLAIPLAVAALVVVQRWSGMGSDAPRRERLGVAAAFAVLAAALTLTHHLTSLFVIFFLACWAAFAWILRRRGAPGPGLAGIVAPLAVLAVMVGLWLGLVAGHSTLAELGDLFSGAGNSIIDLVLGRNGSKHPFSGTGEATGPFERGLIGLYVVGTTALIAAGGWVVWRRRLRDPLALALTGLALLWPLGLALRLTQASTQISGRAPEFVFLGAAFLAAYLVAFPPRLPRRIPSSVLVAATALFVLVVFCGGFVFGELKATRQPGPFLVGAEDRSVSPQGVAAARFAGAHLPARATVLADRDNAMLLGAYGGLDPLFGTYAGFPISRLLISRGFDALDLRATRERSLEYLLVDRRLGRSLPEIGFYVNPEEPRPKEPVSAAALSKFGRVAGISKLYSNGPIAIYDLSPLWR